VVYGGGGGSGGDRLSVPVLMLKRRNGNMAPKKRLFALTLVLLSLAFGIQAQDKESCSNTTLHGSYGLHATGTVVTGDPFHAVGRFTFDGRGNLTGKLFSRVAGDNGESPVFTGTYSVSPECIVTDFWGAPINTTHVSVIVDQGKGYFILNNTSESGDTISAEATRQ
jgi:hypothetical protein